MTCHRQHTQRQIFVRLTSTNAVFDSNSKHETVENVAIVYIKQFLFKTSAIGLYFSKKDSTLRRTVTSSVAEHIGNVNKCTDYKSTLTELIHLPSEMDVGRKMQVGLLTGRNLHSVHRCFVTVLGVFVTFKNLICRNIREYEAS